MAEDTEEINSGEIDISELKLEHFEDILSIWLKVDGLYVKDSSDYKKFSKYLIRNPGLSSVAIFDKKIIGGVLCGHDGIIGYIYHMAVEPDFRNKNLGKRLAERSLRLLSEEGISMCRIFVSKENPHGLYFWQSLGWKIREGVFPMWVDLNNS